MEPLSADLTNDGSVDQYDLNLLQIIFDDSTGILGDVNQDGVVNVSDVVAIVNYIISDDELNDIVGADLNQDGIVNVSDVISIVNQIIG